jgi:hypothetical protein
LLDSIAMATMESAGRVGGEGEFYQMSDLNCSVSPKRPDPSWWV